MPSSPVTAGADGESAAAGPLASSTSRSDTPGSLAARMVLAVIRIYQGLRGGRPTPCRYVPTCSVYAAEAVQHHGAVRGGWLALRRLSRCHPFGSWGYDPVPGTEDAQGAVDIEIEAEIRTAVTT
ncbi:MAG: membrane protein insertion efficiency factor YidD [Acidimicrobiales bacterium]